MTREEIYQQCVEEIAKTNCLLLQLPTGFGKSRCAIDLINHLVATKYQGKKTSMLLLVAKVVYKQTWKEEFEKWGGINVDAVTVECYESMHKHVNEPFTFVLMDEVHHVGSELRMEALKYIKYEYMLGLSATIPRKLRQYFQYRYHSRIVSCDIIEAIEDEVLPEPEILLFPLMLDNRSATEQWEYHPKAPGPIVHAEFRDYKKYKYKSGIHAIISCTPKQKDFLFAEEIRKLKSKWETKRSVGIKNIWLHLAGERLAFLAFSKNQIVQDILKKLQHYRTITFCKTIEQSELLGKYCIHSQNEKADDIYEAFNQKKINHITSVNILNENANLVDCKYAIFANMSSSSIVQAQRSGRALRHKHPVIILPFFKDTREEEIAKKMIEGYKREYIRIIHSIQEI